MENLDKGAMPLGNRLLLRSIDEFFGGYRPRLGGIVVVREAWRSFCLTRGHICYQTFRKYMRMSPNFREVVSRYGIRTDVRY